MREELGVIVVSAEVAERIQLGDVVLDVWTVREWVGSPTNRAPNEHDEMRWFAAEDLPVDTLAHPTLEPFFRSMLATQH